MYDPFADPLGFQILEAFRGPCTSWRTAGGIARQTGLPLNTVQSYFQAHRDLFVQSPLAPCAWNRWQASSGLGGRLAVEQVAGFLWTGWQESVEYASDSNSGEIKT